LYVNFGKGTPSGKDVRASQITWLTTLYDNIVDCTFENLVFEGSNIAAIHMGYQGQREIYSSNRHQVINCDFINHGRNGIHIESSMGMTVQGSTFENIFNTAFDAGTEADSIFLFDNVVHNSGHVHGRALSGDLAANGITLYGQGNKILRNKIRTTGYCGIWWAGAHADVGYNLVDSTGTAKDDGAGIYTVISGGPKPAHINRRVHHNIVLNSLGNYATAVGYGDGFDLIAGIYLDDYTGNVIVDSNFVANGRWSGLFLNTGDGNITIKDNVFFNNPYQLHISLHTPNRVRNTDILGNQFVNKTVTQQTFYFNNQINESPALMGTWNNNVYANPLNPASAHMNYKVNLGPNNLVTISQWKTQTGQDPASTNSLYAISNANQFKVDTNSTISAVIIPLTNSYRDVLNGLFQTSYSLPRNSGKILMTSTDPRPKRREEPPAVEAEEEVASILRQSPNRKYIVPFTILPD
jgi:parallel beta-helix repeat protein